MQASNCDRCYRRKGRCDKQQPCGPCVRANVTCTFTDKVRQRRFTSEDVERIEKRLRQSEARNKSLLDEITRLKTSVEQQGTSPTVTDRSQSDGTKRADAVSEVSYLSINAAGERQPYLGSTSGVLFADLVRSSVDASVSRQSTPPLGESHTRGACPEILAPSSANSRRKQELPPETLVSNLIRSYFDHDAIAFPFLSPSKLLDISERCYRDASFYSIHASAYDAFIFNMVLAIATASVYKYDWQMLPSAESHHARAMQELDQVLALGGVESLQAILLLCQYRQGSSIKDNSASMWHLVGIAALICLELGLHRESAYPILHSHELDQSQLARYHQQEIARRCFWCVIAMDRVTSNILGRPLAVRDEDVDAVLPSDDSDPTIAYSSALTPSRVPRISVFRSIIEYRLLCGKILTILHRRRAPSMTATEAVKIREDLAQSLEEWRCKVEHLHLPDEATANTHEQSCFLSPVWFNVLYANAKLSIWRPCPLLADISHDQVSLQNIYNSSIQAITAYSALHKSRKINYSWIALQSIFMAGLSFIYSVSRHFRERSNYPSSSDCCLLEKGPEAVEISQISRACSNVMVAVAERWNALRHCHEVFNRLSDAVLADALKMQAQPPATGYRPSSSSPNSNRIPEDSRAVGDVVLTNIGTSAVPKNTETTSGYWTGQQEKPLFDTSNTQNSLAVDTEFLHCYDDLQSMYLHQIEDPVMHLSQDWLGFLGGVDGVFDQSAECHGQLGVFE